MAKTSAEVKNRYNSKAYDRINFSVKKGQRDYIKEQAARLGFDSVNKFIYTCILEYIENHK